MRALAGAPARWLVAVLLAATPLAQAQAPEAPPGASLGEAMAWLERRHPELAAMDRELEAARERVLPAGALPDPMFALELRDIRTRDPNLSPSQVGNTRYLLRQTIPLGGKRELRRSVAQAEADQAAARREATRLELRSRLKTAWAQHLFALQAYGETRELARLAQELEQLARVRYETGLAPQQDLIKAQTERTTLASELIVLETERHHASARLNAALGRPAAAPLALPEGWRPIPARARDYAAVRAALQARNPQLAQEAARIEGTRRGEDLARRNWIPDLTVGFAPIQMGERFDTWELMFEVNIPLQQASRQAQAREAVAMRAAAEARRDAVALGLDAEMTEAWAALDAGLQQEALVRGTLLPQAQLVYESAIAGYQSGRVDFASLLDAQRQIRKARLDLLRLRLEQQVRLAALERIVGEDL